MTPLYQTFFNSTDALNPGQSHDNTRWFFKNTPEDLDELERFIAHDEKLYAKYFTN